MQVFILELKKRLIGALAIEQAAYQPGHSIIEQIQTIQQIIEKLIKFQQHCLICFIDYTDTFDSIESSYIKHPIQSKHRSILYQSISKNLWKCNE